MAAFRKLLPPVPDMSRRCWPAALGTLSFLQANSNLDLQQPACQRRRRVMNRRGLKIYTFGSDFRIPQRGYRAGDARPAPSLAAWERSHARDPALSSGQGAAIATDRPVYPRAMAGGFNGYRAVQVILQLTLELTSSLPVKAAYPRSISSSTSCPRWVAMVRE
jgi:hypothetical protein